MCAYEHWSAYGHCARKLHSCLRTCTAQRPHDQVHKSNTGLQNIAYNFQYDEASGTAVYDQWENSPGHRANMVGDFDTVGYGFHRCEADHRSNGRVEGSDRTYWTGLYVRKA